MKIFILKIFIRKTVIRIMAATIFRRNDSGSYGPD